jgi:hypothetical protein
MSASSSATNSTQPPESYEEPSVVWEKYRRDQRLNRTRQAEHNEKQITYRGKTMQYHVVTRGQKPDEGYNLYIALHGGGGVPSENNNKAWERMKSKYLESIEQGIYVAPRGITDTWDMHFQPESYVLYDRLIENMFLFEDVCSDRVYLLGYSAGGDAVYQISPRMADRWAAVHMSAGHPNGVDLRNLANVPIALQAGQHDEAYDRNIETAKMHQVLDSLTKENEGQYIHTTWIHYNYGHTFLDNEPGHVPKTVVANTNSFLTSSGSCDTTECDTNAIRWLDQFKRNWRPQRLIWDLKTRADRNGEGFWDQTGCGQQHYWLDIGDHSPESLGVDTIVVALHKETNAIHVEKAGQYLRILVDRDMLNLEQPINVLIDERNYPVRVVPSRQNQMETVRQRGDPRYIFEGSIILRKVSRDWKVTVGQ